MSATEPDVNLYETSDEPAIDAETKPIFDVLPGDDDRPEEKRPTPNAPRKSAAQLISFAWSGVGMALQRSGTDIPVGRVLQFQAPLAGNKLDELIRHTWLDALIQPLVNQVDKVEGLGALFAFPILVGAYERNPQIAPVVEPILREVIRATLVEMAPAIKKQQADERKAAKAMADVVEGFDIPKGTDPIDAILNDIFDAPEGMGESGGENAE